MCVCMCRRSGWIEDRETEEGVRLASFVAGSLSRSYNADGGDHDNQRSGRNCRHEYAAGWRRLLVRATTQRSVGSCTVSAAAADDVADAADADGLTRRHSEVRRLHDGCV